MEVGKGEQKTGKGSIMNVYCHVCHATTRHMRAGHREYRCVACGREITVRQSPRESVAEAVARVARLARAGK